MQGKTIDRLFLIGMWWRIGYGFLRILVGLVLLRVVGMPLADAVMVFAHSGLIEEPREVLATFASNLLAQHSLYVTYFLASYFLFWGFVDVFLSYNLIKHKLWAFPISFVLISGFVVYEMVRFTHTHSIILLGVIFVDGLILWLVWKEFVRLRQHIIE